MCGLAGYVGRGFEPHLFKLIALAQDVKGRDNAGIGWVNTDEESPKFKTLLGGSDEERIFNVLTNPKIGEYHALSLAELLGDKVDLPSIGEVGLNPIMAHSRKATIGSGTVRNAQPFVYKNIMLMHNGTLLETEKYRTKYQLPGYTSDSQVIAYMIAKGHAKEFFGMYTGTVTCAWVDLNDPEALYVFSGSDKHWATSPTNPRKEIFYLDLPSGTYISSLKGPLEMLKEICKVPSEELAVINQFKANQIYKITDKYGVEEEDYINRRIAIRNRNTSPESSPPPTSPRAALKCLIDDQASLNTTEEDLVQFAGGKYYVGTSIANTTWRVENDNVTYYPVFVDRNTYLGYKKMTHSKYVGVNTKTTYEGNLANLVEVPFLDGILLKTWGDFFRIVKDYDKINIGVVSKSSPIPINVQVFAKEILSEYFITGRGGELTSTVIMPFTSKAYVFVKNMITEVKFVKMKAGRGAVRRYIKTLTAPKTPKQEDTALDTYPKFKMIIGATMRIAEDTSVSNKERSTALEVAKFINSKLSMNDSRVRERIQ